MPAVTVESKEPEIDPDWKVSAWAAPAQARNTASAARVCLVVILFPVLL
jgi:hypothetical protein